MGKIQSALVSAYGTQYLKRNALLESANAVDLRPNSLSSHYRGRYLSLPNHEER
jgi:hypothetical protein